MNPTLKLAELADIRQGYSARKAVKPIAGGTHYILQMRDFDDTRTSVDASGMVRFSPGPVAAENELQPGDVIFLAKGARNFAFAPTGLPPHTLAANYFFIIRPATHTVLPEYIVWFLNRPQTHDHLVRYSGGGVHMPVIRKGILASLEVPLPPKAVQTSITALETLVLRAQALQAELDAKRRVLHEVVCIRAASRSAIPGRPSRTGIPARPGQAGMPDLLIQETPR